MVELPVSLTAPSVAPPVEIYTTTSGD